MPEPITDIFPVMGEEWATPTADVNSNITKMPQVDTPADAQTCQYDSWNRLVRILENGKTVAVFDYDGLGRLVVRRTFDAGEHLIEWRRFVYDAAGRLIQELVRGDEPARRFVNVNENEFELGLLLIQYDFKIDRNYVWGPHGLAFCDQYTAGSGASSRHKLKHCPLS